jgi:hypothetical protein
VESSSHFAEFSCHLTESSTYISEIKQSFSINLAESRIHLEKFLFFRGELYAGNSAGGELCYDELCEVHSRTKHNKKNDVIIFCLSWYAQQQNPYNL